jgi:hypothetical protein
MRRRRDQADLCRSMVGLFESRRQDDLGKRAERRAADRQHASARHRHSPRTRDWRGTHGLMSLRARASQCSTKVLVSDDSSSTRVFTPTGTYTFTAANGDALTADFTGTAQVGTVTSIVEEAVIYRGTGRFAGSTGSFTAQRIFTPAIGVTTGSFEGTISLAVGQP